jgi:tetratricopeptide (TPR) repeat protein
MGKYCIAISVVILALTLPVTVIVSLGQSSSCPISSSAVPWIGNGSMLISQSKYDEAIQAFDKAIELDPQCAASALTFKGKALTKQGKNDEAMQCFNKAIELAPDYEVPWEYKGTVLYKQGKYDEAIQAFDKAIEANSEIAGEAFYYKSRILYNESKYDEVIQCCQQSLELHPQQSALWNIKGMALTKQGKYDDAIQSYDRAIELSPQSGFIWSNKGSALNSEGKYDEAMQALDKAIELDSKYALAWNNKGVALKALGRTSEADAAFAKAKELGYNTSTPVVLPKIKTNETYLNLKANEKLEPVPYTDAQLRFTIQMPKGWTAGKGTDNNRTFTVFLSPSPERDEQGNITFNENINIVSEMTNLSFDNYFANSKWALANLQDYHLIEERNVTLGRISGKIIEQAFTQNGLEMRCLQLFAQEGTTVYVITGLNLASKWDNDKDLIEASLMSFRPPTSFFPAQTNLAANEKPELVPYTDAQLNFTIQMPKGWTAGKGSSNNRTFTIFISPNPVRDQTGNITFNENINIVSEITNLSFDNYFANSKWALGNLQDYHLTRERNVNLGGIYGKIIEQTFTQNGLQISGMQLFVQTGPIAYVITGLNLASKWDGDQDLLEASIISFRPPTSLPIQKWVRTFGGSDNDEANSVQQTTEGGYIVAGYTKSYGSGGEDAWLIKTDSSGIDEWNKTFGGPEDDEANSVQQTSDGGYIIAGYTRSYGAGGKDVWLIKTDSLGNEKWNRTFGGWAGDDIGSSVQQTKDGGYIIAGYNASVIAAGGTGNAWLIKTDPDGNELWDKTFGGSKSDSADSVAQTTEGGYIIAGHTMSFGVALSAVWLINTGPSGNEEWNKTFGGSGYDVANSIQQTKDGGYIISGWTTTHGGGVEDFWLIKTDSSGNKQWDKTFGGTKNDAAIKVQQTSDGGYIIAGDTWSYGSGNGNSDAWLIKTDSSGNKQWDKTFGGTGEDKAKSAQQTKDGGYIITGETESYGTGMKDIWLMKTDAIGNE